MLIHLRLVHVLDVLQVEAELLRLLHLLSVHLQQRLVPTVHLLPNTNQCIEVCFVRGVLENTSLSDVFSLATQCQRQTRVQRHEKFTFLRATGAQIFKTLVIFA